MPLCAVVFHITASMDILQIAAHPSIPETRFPHKRRLSLPSLDALMMYCSLLARWPLVGPRRCKRLAQNRYRQMKKKEEERKDRTC